MEGCVCIPYNMNRLPGLQKPWNISDMILRRNIVIKMMESLPVHPRRLSRDKMGLVNELTDVSCVTELKEVKNCTYNLNIGNIVTLVPFFSFLFFFMFIFAFRIEQWLAARH